MKSAEKQTSASFGQIIRRAFSELGDTMNAFIRAPRALWGINVPYILEGLVYFGILTILGKYCSENVGLNDVYAGWIYGAVTGGITFSMLLLGGVTDKIGVRKSLALALGTMAIGRYMISLSGTLSLGSGLGSPMFFMLIGGLFLMVTAYGLYQPAAYAGVKRYTTPKTAAIGYAVIYSLMNLGAFIFGPISSSTRQAYEEVFPPNGLTAVFWVLTGITVLAFFASLFIITKRVDRRAVERVKKERQALEKDQGEKREPEAESKPVSQKPQVKNTFFLALLACAVFFLIVLLASLLDKVAFPVIFAVALFAASVLAAGWEYLRHRPEHPFRDTKFVFFIFILIPVQTLFAHNWLTIPYYLDRAFIGTWVSDHFEILANLNPIIIFVITPIIAGLTARANIYRMMILGTLVMAAPTFLLVLGPHAVLFVIYIIIMSVGEAMWQPRFLQWVAEIAPEGKTGAYMGIGQFPWFMTKLLTSLYSGHFVANYIPLPETGKSLQTGSMWFYYALIAMISPVALFLARKWMVGGMGKRQA